MAFYSLAVFAHVVFAFVIFAALALEAAALFHLRRAANSLEARAWLDPLPGLPAIMAGSALIVLLSGGYLTAQMSAWTLAWPKIAVATLVLIAPFAAVTGRKMRAIRKLCTSPNTNESELVRRLQDPALKFSLMLRFALVLGIVLLMTAKPGMRESLGVVLLFLVLGAAVGLVRGPRAGAGRSGYTSWNPKDGKEAV